MERVKDPTTETNKPFYKTWWGAILAILFLPLFAIWYVWTKTKWSTPKKSWAILGILVVSIMFMSYDAQSRNNEVTDLATYEFTQEDRDAILAFEKEVNEIEARYKPVMDTYTSTMEKVSSGSANVFDAYNATVRAQEASNAMRSDYFSLSPASTLPREVKGKLRDAAKELGTAYSTRSGAMEAAKRFLDNQKPSDLQLFKDETRIADQFILSAVVKIMEAKTMAGIAIGE